MLHKQRNRKGHTDSEEYSWKIPGEDDQVTYENACKYLKVHDLRRISTSNGVAGKAGGHGGIDE